MTHIRELDTDFCTPEYALEDSSIDDEFDKNDTTYGSETDGDFSENERLGDVIDTIFSTKEKVEEITYGKKTEGSNPSLEEFYDKPDYSENQTPLLVDEIEEEQKQYVPLKKEHTDLLSKIKQLTKQEDNDDEPEESPAIQVQFQQHNLDKAA